MLISKNIRLKKLSSLIILFLVIASVYFINAFFLYFSDNTNFNHNQSSFFIDSNDNLDSLAINLKPYLKSINNFIKVSKKP